MEAKQIKFAYKTLTYKIVSMITIMVLLDGYWNYDISWL